MQFVHTWGKSDINTHTITRDSFIYGFQKQIQLQILNFKVLKFKYIKSISNTFENTIYKITYSKRNSTFDSDIYVADVVEDMYDVRIIIKRRAGQWNVALSLISRYTGSLYCACVYNYVHSCSYYAYLCYQQIKIFFQNVVTSFRKHCKVVRDDVNNPFTHWDVNT